MWHLATAATGSRCSGCGNGAGALILVSMVFMPPRARHLRLDDQSGGGDQAAGLAERQRTAMTVLGQQCPAPQWLQRGSMSLVDTMEQYCLVSN